MRPKTTSSRRAVLGGGLAMIALPAIAQTTARQPADVVFVNGRIHTLDANNSTATAIAVRDGKFLAVGSNAEILRLAGPQTQQVDFDGRTVVPGLIDGHAHPMETIYLKEEWVDARFPNKDD